MFGRVMWWSEARGRGVIVSALSGEKYFFHISGVKGESVKNLNQGDRVEFSLLSSDKGIKAIDVVVVK